ncbi:nucleoside triphosphate pyrophosphohydrolase [Streptomyces sp. NPDC049585]|uniref:nucleoside triphosphate pyrophosphohydrolase n=1 Tax=Streptomyces sp. NPDC049585 TaxID=3155154 RepID=UPI003417847C
MAQLPLAAHDWHVLPDPERQQMDSSGKLVRDRIPEIIRAEGREPITYVASPIEYRRRLREKLTEEVAEFLSADDAAAPGELADILEVVRALATNLGIDAEALEELRRAKYWERGGFTRRIVWTGNRPSAE